MINMIEYRREYKRRWMAARRARSRGFDDHKAAFLALKLIDQGLSAGEVRAALYLAAREGLFGVMNKFEKQEVKQCQR